MSKLFVITYKRPALSIEKITMEIDDAYDCEALPSEEIAQIRLKDAQNKYDDVDMFECEDYEYVEFMKNDEAVAHFTRTGEHSMKPIEGMDEDVEVGVENHTETIYLKLEMTRPNESVSFDYDVDIDDVGQIVFTPHDSSASFVDIERLAGYDSTDDVVDGNTRRFAITLTANMLSDDGEFDWFCDVDEIGQAVVTPDAENTSFLSVSVADSLNLVTEAKNSIVMEALDPSSEEFAIRLQEAAARVDALQELFESAISVAEDLENDFRALGCHSADIDGYMIRYLEKYIEDREGEVSCADFRRRLEEVMPEQVEEPVEESIEPVNENDIVMEKMDELDRHNILDRFMKGELGPYSDDGEPKDSYIHLDELDTINGKTSYTYYYDEESDAVVCYSHKVKKDER